MRQRKVKALEEKLNKVKSFRVENPLEQRGGWSRVFGNNNPIHLEIGCGKGKFILEHSMRNPDINYIAIEGQESVVLRAMEKAALLQATDYQADNLEQGYYARPSNLIFVSSYVEDLRDFFTDGELEGIYLNFSDPWPKTRHEKRRLTHINRLQSYGKVLNNKGFFQLKTDNDGLFLFSLDQVKAWVGDEVFNNKDRVASLWDLHGSEALPQWLEIRTEYEDKFMEMGKPIHFLRVAL